MIHKLIKIHGTSGSGKSTLARLVMQRGHSTPLVDAQGKVEAYQINFPLEEIPVFVLGRYATACGGMDTVSPTKAQVALIDKYAEKGHVLYEGLLMSTYYGMVGKAMEKYGDQHVWAFLDTPIETCIRRIKARREEAGNKKPLNEANTRGRMKPINSLKARLTRKGCNVITIDYTGDVAQQALEALYS